MIVCPSCGQENPEGFRLCGMCGTLAELEPPVEALEEAVTLYERKGNVTALARIRGGNLG